MRCALVAVAALAALGSCAAGGGVSHASDAATYPREPVHVHDGCATCETVARALETALYALEAPGTDVAGGWDEAEAARRGARRRGLTHGRSELKIAAVIAGLCDALAEDDAAVEPRPEPGACASLVDAFADELETHVFAEGPREMRDFLCVRLHRACPRLVTARGHGGRAEATEL
jgi:hypothetical protein